jgi:hypothetical protein
MLQFYNSCTVLNTIYQPLVKHRRHGLKPLPLEVKRKRSKWAPVYSSSYIVLGFDRWNPLGRTSQNETTWRKVGTWRRLLFSSLTLYTPTWEMYVKAHRHGKGKIRRCPTWLQCSFPKFSHWETQKNAKLSWIPSSRYNHCKHHDL